MLGTNEPMNERSGYGRGYRVAAELDDGRRVEEEDLFDETHDDEVSLAVVVAQPVVVVVRVVVIVVVVVVVVVGRSFVVCLDQEQNEDWTDKTQQYLTTHHRLPIRCKGFVGPSVRLSLCPMYKIC